MNLLNTKIRTSDDIENLPTKNFRKKVIALVKKEPTDLLRGLLDGVKERKGTVDVWYGTKTLPYIVLTSKMNSEKKYEMLEFLLTNYKFNLNKDAISKKGKKRTPGNIIVQSLRHSKEYSIKIYKLLIDQGAYVNSSMGATEKRRVWLSQNTAIDELRWHSSEDSTDLEKYLRSRGGRDYFNRPRKFTCCKCHSNLVS